MNSLLDTPFCPTSYRYIPLPLRHAIQHCNKRRPLSTLLKSYRVKTLLLGNRKTILLKWIIAVTFKFWFHRLHVLFLVTKSASLKMKFSCYRTENILSSTCNWTVYPLLHREKITGDAIFLIRANYKFAVIKFHNPP